MNEKMKLENFPDFKVGDLVIFKEDLLEEIKEALSGVLDVDTVYKVCLISPADEEGPARAWLGSASMSEEDVNRFDPNQTFESHRKIMPVGVGLLRRARLDS